MCIGGKWPVPTPSARKRSIKAFLTKSRKEPESKTSRINARKKENNAWPTAVKSKFMKILVIEDEHKIAKDLIKTVRGFGYDILRGLKSAVSSSKRG